MEIKTYVLEAHGILQGFNAGDLGLGYTIWTINYILVFCFFLGLPICSVLPLNSFSICLSMQSFFSLPEGLFVCLFLLFSPGDRTQFKRKNNIESIGTKALFPWYLLFLREINLILINVTQEETSLIANICLHLFGLYY